MFENSEKAANNYKFGWDIEENQAEAEKIMAQVFKIWASANEEGGK